ncbi:CPBP family intramembrane metalloprotease [Spiractinospora alimapuensis]|uniref:CPBP family intramembrane glutamic endopeptidase n=1 Tax=Spiractinospora alimapuensis TaxID=2820884 RepID=UPI001F3E03DD|nr:CPBP family intramembrane glutamic endopeptidase [Spiractinospora alimapuensis]QVQ53967.1 CPBP family intramembrane metalloprotease [Spiractinospora alimapuensis]
MRVVWQLAAVVAVGVLGGQGVLAVQDDPWLTLGVGVAVAVLALVAYRLVVQWTERRPVTEVARRGIGPGLVGGALLGTLLFGLVIVNIAFLGGYQVHGRGTLLGVVGLFGFMAAAAVTEEVLFRGVLLRLIEERVGTWIALLTTAVLFGAWHLPNPNASLWGALVVTLGGGTMLAAAYVATRSLWLPIGLHFGWNFAAAAIFSTEVSGNDTAQGLLDASTSGPTLVSGGEFGPEASAYSIVCPMIATVALLWWARRRGHWMPLRAPRHAQAPSTAKLPR